MVQLGLTHLNVIWVTMAGYLSHTDAGAATPTPHVATNNAEDSCMLDEIKNQPKLLLVRSPNFFSCLIVQLVATAYCRSVMRVNISGENNLLIMLYE